MSLSQPNALSQTNTFLLTYVLLIPLAKLSFCYFLFVCIFWRTIAPVLTFRVIPFFQMAKHLLITQFCFVSFNHFPVNARSLKFINEPPLWHLVKLTFMYTT